MAVNLASKHLYPHSLSYPESSHKAVSPSDFYVPAFRLAKDRQLLLGPENVVNTFDTEIWAVHSD